MILFTGRGTSGSWIVRGEQVGREVGRAVKRATLRDCQKAQAIVVVKRATPELLRAVRRSGRPWALDVVDLYPQPECTAWSRADSIKWVRRHIAALRPDAIIWPNTRMRDDCSTGQGHETIIYHHHRPELQPKAPGPAVAHVGYEGSARYLAEWHDPIAHECRRRGWAFHVNARPVDQLDIVIAVRGRAFDGYAQRHWKSNVKQANAHAAGAVFIGSRECGYLENRSPFDVFLNSPFDLPAAFDRAAGLEFRSCAAESNTSQRITLESVAEQYRDFLHAV